MRSTGHDRSSGSSRSGQQPSTLRSPTASSPPWRAQPFGASPTDPGSPRLPPRPRSATADSPHARRVQIQQRMATSRSGQQQIQNCASSGELVVLPIHVRPSPETSTVTFSTVLATLPCSPLARNRTTATMAATRPTTRTADPVQTSSTSSGRAAIPGPSGERETSRLQPGLPQDPGYRPM